MPLLREKGFDFGFDPTACGTCPSRCCRGVSGRVWVTRPDIERIAAYLRINAIDLILSNFNRVGNRLAIKERRVDGQFECLFLEGPHKRCAIYPARPHQCRRFPFWEAFRGRKALAAAECPGIRD